MPTEAVLAQMRAADPPVHYLVGTPKGRLTRLEQALIEKPWHAARPGVKVKLLAEDGELYVFAESRDRVAKERSMRRRQLKWLWARLEKLATMSLTRDGLLMKLGAAQTKAPAAWRLIELEVAKRGASFTYRLDRDKLRQIRRREGRYLLRTNLTESDPAKLWQFYSRNWSKSRRPSRPSKAISRSARSSIRKSGASKRTSSSRSWLTACT